MNRFILPLFLLFWSVQALTYSGLLARADEQFSRRGYDKVGLENSTDARYNYLKVADKNFYSLEGQFAVGKYLMANYFAGRHSDKDKQQSFNDGLAYGQRSVLYFETTYGRLLNSPQFDERAKKIFSHVLVYWAMNLYEFEKLSKGSLPNEWKKIERYQSLVNNWGYDSIHEYAYDRLKALRLYEAGQYTQSLNLYQDLFNKTNSIGISRLGEVNYYLIESLKKTGGNTSELQRKIIDLDDYRSSVEFWPETKYYHGLIRSSAKSDIIPGEFIVEYKQAPKFKNILSKTGANWNIQQLTDKVFLVKRPSVELSSYSIQALLANNNIKRVEPNIHIHISQNDPLFIDSWGFKNIGNLDPKGLKGVAGVDIKAEEAWQITSESPSVIVGVIDTGIDFSHEDLKDNAWINEAEKNGKPGVDDDNNGYIDDIHGYDFINNTAKIIDDHGHGTHVAGIIGAQGNNHVGIAGVNWNVKIMALKFLTKHGGGDLASALKAIDYAKKMGAHITNNSWGTGQQSEILKNAIADAGKKGILFVAAAGNDGVNLDNSPTYPAAYNLDNIVSVAAIDARGSLATFSNYSLNLTDIAAPGQNIISCIPGDDYKSWSGTSMAAPFVTGVATLLLGREEKLTPLEIKNRLIASASPLRGLKSLVKSGGLLNAYTALLNIKASPDPNDPGKWLQESQRLSSQHPYQNSMDQEWTFHAEGAQKMTLYFKNFDLEAGFDKLYFFDKHRQPIEAWTGVKKDIYSPQVEGDTIVVRLVTDKTISNHGFDIESIAYEK